MNTDSIKFGKNKSAGIFSDIAMDFANHITTKSTQLRKFYNEIILWNDKVNIPALSKDNREVKFKELEPFIKMVKAKVAYAKNRGHVDDNLKEILFKCIDEIKNAETLQDAKLFLEAIVAFSKK